MTAFDPLRMLADRAASDRFFGSLMSEVGSSRLGKGRTYVAIDGLGELSLLATVSEERLLALPVVGIADPHVLKELARKLGRLATFARDRLQA